MPIRVSNFLIEKDSYGVVVYKERKKRNKKNLKEFTDEDTTELIGYFSSVGNALAKVLDVIAEDGVAESKSLKAIADSLEEGKQEMRKLFKGIVCPDS